MRSRIGRWNGRQRHRRLAAAPQAVAAAASAQTLLKRALVVRCCVSATRFAPAGVWRPRPWLGESMVKRSFSVFGARGPAPRPGGGGLAMTMRREPLGAAARPERRPDMVNGRERDRCTKFRLVSTARAPAGRRRPAPPPSSFCFAFVDRRFTSLFILCRRSSAPRDAEIYRLAPVNETTVNWCTLTQTGTEASSLRWTALVSCSLASWRSSTLPLWAH